MVSLVSTNQLKTEHFARGGLWKREMNGISTSSKTLQQFDPQTRIEINIGLEFAKKT